MARKEDVAERRESYIELADKISRIEVAVVKGFAEANAQHRFSNAAIDDIKKYQQDIFHVIYGNGKEGLITKIARISQKISIVWGSLAAMALAYLAAVGGIVQEIIVKLIH